MNGNKHIKNYKRRYEQWKRNVVATSVFVIACGVMAAAYLLYRAVMLGTPLASIEQSIFNSHNNIQVICQEDGTDPPKHQPMISAVSQTNIQDAARLSPNIIANGDLSQVDAETGEPVGFSRSVEEEGIAYQYLDEAPSGTKFLRVVSSRNRTAKQIKPAWQVNPVELTSARETYAYSFWYRSTTPINVSVESTVKDQIIYDGVTTLEPSDSWRQFTAHFYNANDASTFRFSIAGADAGQIDTRSFDIHQIPDAATEKGIVSVTFDDGWKSIIEKALPLLERYDISTTQYIISEAADRSVAGYMTYDDIIKFKNAGHEIGSHTLTHCDQTKLSPDVLQNNAIASKQALESQEVGPVKSFAYPLGTYDKTTQKAYQKRYPLIRTSDFGYNDRYFDVANIRSVGILSDTSDAEFKSWLAYAKEHRLWVVLVYHRVDELGHFSVTSSQLERQLKMIHDSGLAVMPLSEAAAAVRK